MLCEAADGIEPSTMKETKYIDMNDESIDSSDRSLIQKHLLDDNHLRKYVKVFDPTPCRGDIIYPIADPSKISLIPKTTRRLNLTLSLLKTIRDSVNHDSVRKIFRGIDEVDLVIGGGGLKGFFACGASDILVSTFAHHGIKIVRTAGTSTGAFAAMFLMVGITTGHWIQSYYCCQEAQTSSKSLLENTDEVWKWMEESLPENAYEMCNNRLFICYTMFSPTITSEVIVSRYSSNRDLYEACRVSASSIYFNVLISHVNIL